VNPRLASISGPLKDSLFPLSSALSIGSEPSNHISLADPAVASQHCDISTDGGRFTIKDLDTPAGTFVNGIPIKQRVLAHGDLISIGDSSFLFLAEATPASQSSGVQLDDSAGLSGSAFQRKQEDLLFLTPESLASLPPAVRLARTLTTLLKISTAIGSLQDVDALQWQLLGMLFDVIPAERGAVLLADSQAGEFSSPVAWDRFAGPDHPVHVSRALVQRVVKERISILDSSAASSADSSASSPTNPAKSCLCVPLATPAQSLGLIYLETLNATTPFTDEDLQLLSAVAGLAAVAIENARQFQRLGSENLRLRAEASLQHDMIGRGPRMLEVYQFIERVAPSDSTALIFGESGTGKELAASAIHLNSPRKAQAFVALNCAALTETLLESELFGHERGAFTSAVSQKKGLLEVAEGGTVFLDEVAELPHALQAKLLRVLQEREFVRVGGTHPIKLNVRFIAATNKDLQKAVKEERFRLDLFYRLNVVSFTMPALREHPEDIPILTDYFVSRYSARCNRKIRGVSPEARACLAHYDWPGNVRELENAIERAVVIGASDVILSEDLPETLVETDAPLSSAPARYHDAILNLKKQMIVHAFDQSGGNVTQAAKILGVHPNYLHRLVRNLNLKMSLKSAAKS